MIISHVKIENYRALKSISVAMNRLSVLIGENDVGKTSFLYALEAFFTVKKLSDTADWHNGDTDNDICITLTFSEFDDVEDLNEYKKDNGDIELKKVFPIGSNHTAEFILQDGTVKTAPPKILNDYFTSDSFHLIPVRRDLNVQLSMAKKALLGTLIRKIMKLALEKEAANESITLLQSILSESVAVPKDSMQIYLREQMHNDSIELKFDDLEIDPVEGVKFNINLSDEKGSSVKIENRGAGTQNNLIIALFRTIAKMDISGKFIFAMEEPENSLHPKAQRQLLSVINSISVASQVIITTHSPVFIDRTKYESNIWLTRTADGSTIAKTFDDSMIADVKADLGIRASDALLKGGGNCAILVEGATEENGFPVFMEMIGISEFELGISIINMGGCDFEKVSGIVKLLKSYDIPCVVVLDRDANKPEEDLKRAMDNSLGNLKGVYRLSKGTIEDYYPLDIIADVINFLSPSTEPVTADSFDTSKHEKGCLGDIRRVIHESGAKTDIGYLKSSLGTEGTIMMRDKDHDVDSELTKIFEHVKAIASQ
jgi:predicted ATP-dependent endonuclease of OLD family